MTWPLVNPAAGYISLSRFESLSWRPWTSTSTGGTVVELEGGEAPRSTLPGGQLAIRRRAWMPVELYPARPCEGQRSQGKRRRRAAGGPCPGRRQAARGEADRGRDRARRG